MHDRVRRIIVGLALALPASALGAQDPASPGGLSLEQALEIAFERSPELTARRAEVEELRARLVTARTYPYNPEVSAAAGRRRGPGAQSTDRSLAVSQEIEIGGQRGRRAAVVEAFLAAGEARFQRDQRVLAGRVALAFGDALRTRELLRIEEADAALARGLRDIEEKRLEAGKATQIELNVARAAAGRSVRRVELAKGAYREARSALAEAIGLPPASPPDPVGDLAGGTDAAAGLPPLQELVKSALENREDLAAFRSQEEAALAEIALERSLVRPNLVASAFQDREEGTDDITGVGLTIGIPLFNRNRGRIAEAGAAARRVAAEAAVARLAVEREVASAYALYQAASAAAQGLGEQVIGSLEENLGLLQRSLEAGKISRTEVFLLRREFVESQREYLDALGQALQARVQLDLAAGRLPIPTEPNRSPEP
jgi:cobalt-zinc-cadmium efflux system outer membrane protein